MCRWRRRERRGVQRGGHGAGWKGGGKHTRRLRMRSFGRRAMEDTVAALFHTHTAARLADACACCALTRRIPRLRHKRHLGRGESLQRDGGASSWSPPRAPERFLLCAACAAASRAGGRSRTLFSLNIKARRRRAQPSKWDQHFRALQAGSCSLLRRLRASATRCVARAALQRLLAPRSHGAAAAACPLVLSAPASLFAWTERPRLSRCTCALARGPLPARGGCPARGRQPSACARRAAKRRATTAGVHFMALAG